MTQISYVVFFKVLLFLGGVLAAAAWIDMQSLGRVAGAGSVRLRTVPALRVFVLFTVGLSGLHFASVAYLKTFRPAFLAAHLYPYDTPYMGFFRFIDTNIYVNRIAGLHTPAFWNPGFTLRPDVPTAGIAWQYPPAAVLPYAFLNYGGMPNDRFFVLCTLLFVVPAFAFARWLAGRGVRPWAAYGFVLFSLLLSYPLWTEIPVGNIEVFTAALGAAAVLLYLRGRITAAAVLVGLMTGIKLFPFIFFGLFFAKKQYRQIAWGLLTALVVNVAGLWLMAPGMLHSLRLVREGFAENREQIILTHRMATTEIDHSLFGFIKQTYFVLTHGGSHVPPRILSAYLLAAALGALLLYFTRIRQAPVLNQILALTVLTILLPPTSHDYTLIYLYVPWALAVVMAVQAARSGWPVAGLVPVMACFGVLFSSEMELIHHGQSYNGQFKCLVLLLLLAVSLRYPWQLSDLRGPRTLTEAPAAA